MKKKIALLLALSMVFSMLSGFVVFASDELEDPNSGEIVVVEEEGDDNTTGEVEDEVEVEVEEEEEEEEEVEEVEIIETEIPLSGFEDVTGLDIEFAPFNLATRNELQRLYTISQQYDSGRSVIWIRGTAAGTATTTAANSQGLILQTDGTTWAEVFNSTGGGTIPGTGRFTNWADAGVGAARTAANTVLENASATPEEIDAAYQALLTAIYTLIPAATAVANVGVGGPTVARPGNIAFLGARASSHTASDGRNHVINNNAQLGSTTNNQSWNCHPYWFPSGTPNNPGANGQYWLQYEWPIGANITDSTIVFRTDGDGLNTPPTVIYSYLPIGGTTWVEHQRFDGPTFAASTTILANHVFTAPIENAQALRVAFVKRAAGNAMAVNEWQVFGTLVGGEEEEPCDHVMKTTITDPTCVEPGASVVSCELDCGLPPLSTPIPATGVVLVDGACIGCGLEPEVDFNDLLLYYIFDKADAGADGNAIKDYSSKGNDSVISGDVTAWDDDGFLFTAAGENYIQIPASAGLVNPQMTIVYSGQRTGAVGNTTIFNGKALANGTNGWNANGLWLKSNGYVAHNTDGSNVIAPAPYRMQDFTLNTPVQFAYSANSGVDSFYAINGVRVGNGSAGAISAPTGEFYRIGANAWDNGDPMEFLTNFRMATFMIFNVALDEHQVAAVYAGALDIEPEPEPDPDPEMAAQIAGVLVGDNAEFTFTITDVAENSLVNITVEFTVEADEITPADLTLDPQAGLQFFDLSFGGLIPGIAPNPLITEVEPGVISVKGFLTLINPAGAFIPVDAEGNVDYLKLTVANVAGGTAKVSLAGVSAIAQNNYTEVILDPDDIDEEDDDYVAEVILPDPPLPGMKLVVNVNDGVTHLDDAVFTVGVKDAVNVYIARVALTVEYAGFDPALVEIEPAAGLMYLDDEAYPDEPVWTQVGTSDVWTAIVRVSSSGANFLSGDFVELFTVTVKEVNDSIKLTANATQVVCIVPGEGPNPGVFDDDDDAEDFAELDEEDVGCDCDLTPCKLTCEKLAKCTPVCGAPCEHTGTECDHNLDCSCECADNKCVPVCGKECVESEEHKCVVNCECECDAVNCAPNCTKPCVKGDAHACVVECLLDSDCPNDKDNECPADCKNPCVCVSKCDHVCPICHDDEEALDCICREILWLIGDINMDGEIDWLDLSYILLEFGTTVTPGDKAALTEWFDLQVPKQLVPFWKLNFVDDDEIDMLDLLELAAIMKDLGTW